MHNNPEYSGQDHKAEMCIDSPSADVSIQHYNYIQNRVRW